VIDNLRRCADAAQHAGITLGLEPEWFLGSAERVERVIRFVNHPNLRPNFDPTNLYLYGSDPVAAFDRFAPSILSGHIKDGVRRGEKRWEVDVGKGELDYPALFQRILDRGRGINLFIEHCNSSQAVRAAAAHIKKVVDDAFAQSRRTGKE
jgi:sugar phosphate isomerase/epimerase